MSDDGLSMELDAMYPAAQPIAPPTGWHGRRLLTFGASEVPALLIALGMEQPDDSTPGYVLELAERLIDIKAGLRKPRKAGAAADRGSAAETQVVEAWNAHDRGDWPAITHASSVPREWLPLIDRRQPRLSCTPDAWCYIGGELVNVQIKTDVRGDKTQPTREWAWQVNAECAVTGAAGSLLLYAPGWASWRREDKRRCVAWVVERDDAMIDRIRDAAARGWQLVEQARAAARKETGNER